MSKVKKTTIFLTVLVLGLWGVIDTGAQSLRSLTEQLRSRGREFYIGCAVPSNFSGSDQEIVRTEFDIVTCENDMKIGTISPSQGQYNYSGGDRLLSFAQSNNMVFHGHCFVWHKYNPGWVTGTKSMMETYINAVATHFRGNIYVWDVVNEAFHRDGSYRINAIGSGGQDGASVYGQQQGKQYIEDAFKAAHSADPNAKLMYNDYAIETNDAKFDGMYTMLQDFTRRGVPIHAVGFQGHVYPEFTEAMAHGLAEKMQRVADLGLEIYITEMDGGAPDTSASGLEHQADIYYWVAKACLDQPMCRALQVWGIRDNQSWRINPDDPVDRAVAPLIFDDSGNKKPAYYAIQQALLEAVNNTSTPVPGTLGDVNGDGSVSIVDALLTAQYYVGLSPSGFITANADVNRDGSITIADALRIAQYYVGIISGF
ncbi:MAG: endo-1,4-beta-xylanase [Spirochaetales bacterium]|nr:endo-1,4-beta-xylanase [Spirochaetales bacterium]